MPASDDLRGAMLRKGPSSGTLFILLSQMKQEGDLRRLIQAGTRALDIYPEDIPIRKLMAEAFLEAGMISQAEAEMEKVSRQIKDLATIYKPRAELFARQRRSREALEAIQTYLAHHPDDRDALDLLRDLTPSEEAPAEGMPEYAHQEAQEEHYEEISQPPPEETLPLEEEQPPLQFEREFEPEFEAEFEAEFEPGPEAEPQPVIPPHAEAPAEPVFEEAEPSPPPDIATPTLAEVYIAQGQWQEAIRTYERVLELYPEDDHSRQRLQEIRNMEASVQEVEMPAPAASGEDAPVDASLDEGTRMREKTQKMITTLEAWLEEIREMSKPVS